MLLKIFGRLKWLRYLSWVAIAVIGAFYFSITVSTAVIASPRTGGGVIDYLEAQDGLSVNSQHVQSLVQGGFNFCSDLFILILPMPAIWTRNLATVKKIGISAIFLTGIMSVVPSPKSDCY